MSDLMFGILYLVGFLVGFFVVVPFLKARTDPMDEETVIMGFFGSALWPVSIAFFLGYIFLWLPGVWLFERSEKFFTPKPPPPPPEVDPVKSTYRHVEFVPDDETYSPQREV